MTQVYNRIFGLFYIEQHFGHFDTNIQIIMTSFLAEDCNVISVDWRDLAGPAPWYDVIRQVRVNPKEKPYNYKASLLG